MCINAGDQKGYRKIMMRVGPKTHSLSTLIKRFLPLEHKYQSFHHLKSVCFELKLKTDNVRPTKIKMLDLFSMTKLKIYGIIKEIF